MNLRLTYIIALLAALCLAACSGTDDVSFPYDGLPEPADPLERAVVEKLHSHSEGSGFPIVVMGDGYTLQAIADGTYRRATQKVIDALFAYEPMASLRQYFDIYEITAVSTHDGIDYTKHETAFSARLQGGGSTNVWGDSIAVQQYALKALNGSTALLNRALVIVQLNCEEYAGVTLLAYDKSVTDSIPSGLSLSYIPIAATHQGQDLFPLLVQHEAVGHGIGKLADEYFYDIPPEAEAVTAYNEGRKYGLYMNTHCHPEAEGIIYGQMQLGDKTLYDMYAHRVEEYSLFYPLTQDERYEAEGLAWWQGAFTYPTLFYRPTLQSLMNETANEGGDRFNAPSRLMIYKRVMREAYGKQWTCDLNQPEDYEAFTAFDAPGRWAQALGTRPTSPAKAIKGTASPLPHLAPPRMLP